MDRVTVKLIWNGVEIVVGKKRLRDAMLIDVLANKLPQAEGMESLYQLGWCNLMGHTVSITGLDYPLPTVASSVEEVWEAFQRFLDLPEDLTEEWTAKSRELENVSSVPIAEKPLEDLTEDQIADPN